MISRLVVRNYQSIQHADLELGRFTVVVGPSSSGKSALMRAIKMLANNARGDSYVTTGEKLSSVSAHVEDGVVTITRGPGVGEYKITNTAGESKTFTKLGGAVPEEIGPFLGVRSKDPIHFAGQFDRPFLLDDSGSEVARVLGELTNVSLIFGASREANRRRLADNSKLKTRVSDKAALLDEVQEYRGLPDKLKAMTEAESSLERALEIRTRVSALSSLLSDLRVASVALENAQQFVSVEVPSYDRIQTAVDKKAAYAAVMNELRSASNSMTEATKLALTAEKNVERLEQEYHDLLHEAGVCPTCGQSTKELTSVPS